VNAKWLGNLLLKHRSWRIVCVLWTEPIKVYRERGGWHSSIYCKGPLGWMDGWIDKVPNCICGPSVVTLRGRWTPIAKGSFSIHEPHTWSLHSASWGSSCLGWLAHPGGGQSGWLGLTRPFSVANVSLESQIKWLYRLRVKFWAQGVYLGVWVRGMNAKWCYCKNYLVSITFSAKSWWSENG
jgi:hypothetical protein